MSWTHLRDSLTNTRKAHVCVLCGREINNGTKAIKRVGISFGKLRSDYMHTSCEELTRDWDALDWETFSIGDGEWPQTEE